MDLSYFKHLSLPFIQLFILFFFALMYLKNFLAKKTYKTQFQKLFENLYSGHNTSQTFEKLNIDKDLKFALEKYFYGGEKSEKQKIFSLGKKYIK